jgi:peptide/nickel transport system permease protein
VKRLAGWGRRPRVRYVARRLALAAVVLVGVVTVTFVVARIVPSDPAALWAGARATPAQVEQAERELQLDRSLPVQYADYVRDLVRGDLGVSFATHREITDDLGVFLPATLELVVVAMLVAALVGIPIGVLAAARPGSIFDQASRLLAVAGVSLPTFWLALLLQLVFFAKLGILPLSGRISDETALTDPFTRVTGFYLIDTLLSGSWGAFIDALEHLALPAATLAAYPLGLAIRMTRASMGDALRERYVLAARASGIREREILFRFALKNAILPTLTVLALSFAYAITGAFLIEFIFSWPGIGNYAANAVLNVDFPVILATTTVVAAIYVVVNLGVDLVQLWLDPRV